MGCASSKQQKRCRHCQNRRPYTPVTRSYSMHVHHPPQSENDSYHVVALTSTTLGSLEKKTVDLAEAMTWSAAIDRKIAPLQTPPGEPETVNAWELMEGLDDDVSPFRSPVHLRSFSFDVVGEKLPESPPKTEPEKRQGTVVVLYHTSLRGVRKTYEDCCHVRAALGAHGVRVDDRDVSMHSAFRDELRRRGGGLVLPRVFVAGRCVGGADEIRRLDEEGRLGKLLEGCERVGDGEACEACGDVRFLPCDTCSGSCKVYCEEEEDNNNNNDYGFQRCPDCNENGLIRCPICCY